VNGGFVQGFDADSGARGQAYIHTGDDVAGMDNTQSSVDIVSPSGGGGGGGPNPG
jgi:hypothetical protein